MLSWTRLETDLPFGQNIIDCPPDVPLEALPYPNSHAQISSLTISNTKSHLTLRKVPLTELEGNPSNASLRIEVYF